MNTKYNPSNIESKWYDYWMEKDFFHSVPDEREAYTIVIPPPNVTGVLHMGHMLNNTIQDVLIRRARMQGYNACWVPGTDHASIATEAKVVKMLAAQGIKKSDITREEFLKYAFEWKEKYGGIILKQLRTLGASCDWKRTRFTMGPKLSEAVIHVFVDLYNKGQIYRDYRMCNWDPAAKTALSDQEVIHREEKSKLYHVRYQVEGTDEYVTIATTRPETILGDTAVCFHPEDERYQSFKGKRVIVPMVNRSIPLIYDEYVTMEFGTGALKVTPAHDTNDFALGQKHKLEIIDIFNDDGTLNEKAELFVGIDRFEARKLAVAELEKLGALVQVEEIDNKVGYSERTDAVVEPKLKQQWWMDMSHITPKALSSVMEDEIKFYPKKYKNVYRHWLENIKDWCISRQLWWGQRIPVYYINGDQEHYVVAETAEEALKMAQEKTGDTSLTAANLEQDPDVVDTWFSSWLWPISVFDGFETKEEVDYYYPTSVLVTGWDIIFFWVARMVMAGYEWRQERPFDAVYFTGMVRDPQRRKMSKSLGNSPDPADLIRDYGADGVRLGLLLSSPAGGDLLFEDKLCEQGRNFSNKIWNALIYVKGLEVVEGTNENNLPAIAWFESKFNKTLAEIEEMYKSYRLSEIVKTLYSFIWNDFFSSYLELIKPDYQTPIDQHTYDCTLQFFENAMKLLHPFMPFITEEIYHLLKERDAEDCIMVSDYPKGGAVDENALLQGDTALELWTKVRDVRNQNQLKQRDPLTMFAQVGDEGLYTAFMHTLKRKAFLEAFEFTKEDIDDATSFRVGKDTFFIKLEGLVDMEKEKERLEEELKYNKGFKTSVMKKLGNERFVNNAPAAVVDKERKKLADAEEKIKLLEESLARLN